MKYKNIVEGKFIERPNRFIARIEVDGKEERAHVKNTGRCRELLIPGTEIYLEDFSGRMGSRKMRYSLIGVKKGEELVNIDSQAPNAAVKEALLSGKLQLPEMAELSVVKAEYKYGNSRLDFFVEDINGKKGLIEVKGVTLEEEGVAKFPDAPTERGVRHVEELTEAVKENYSVYVIFVIQMKGIKEMQPNDKTHRAFGDALRNAEKAGVHILAYDCLITEDSMEVDNSISVNL